MNPRPGAAALLLLAATSLPCAAAAQLSARADVTTGGRYVWHGVSRAAGLTLQPSVAAGLRIGRLSLDGGAVLHYELDRVSAGELSQRPAGDPGLGETDFWARAALLTEPARLEAGVVRQIFRSPLESTTEMYAALATTSRYFNPSLEAWWDVTRGGGAFLRGSFDMPVLGWPYPPFAFAFVDGEVGFAAHRSFTHAGVGAGVELRAGRLRGVGWATLAAGLRTQLNFEAATRFDGAGKEQNFLVWWWTGMTLLLGGDARSLR